MILGSCKEDPTPKPKGFLKLEYPEVVYKKYLSDCPFTFDINTITEIEKPRGGGNYCGMNISYPRLNGKIHLTYIAVDEELLTKSLKEAQNLTLSHAQKAESIETYPTEDKTHNRYGMVYVIEGNAASPVQFYITDNKKHFLRGAAYFNTKPNYDSIFPAVHYLKKDIKVLMESVEWKD